MIDATLAVIAKAPAPGRSKTRLCPPLSPLQAAALADAALRDTLASVARTRVARKVLVLDGDPGPWAPDGFALIAQRGDGLDERLARAFSDLPGATLIIGMDTPQASPALLEHALEELTGTDSVLGPAMDGGYWTIGLRDPDPRAVLGVPMSSPDTFDQQRCRLRELGLAVHELPELRDVDTYEDALAVAAAATGSAFSRVLRAIDCAPTAA